MHEEIETNFFGTVRVTQQALKWMRPQQGEVGEKEKKEEEEEKEHRGGLIVNMSSLAGVCAFPGHSFYHASKFAVEGWTESVAKEMHPDWNSEFCIFFFFVFDFIPHLCFLFVYGWAFDNRFRTLQTQPNPLSLAPPTFSSSPPSPSPLLTSNHHTSKLHPHPTLRRAHLLRNPQQKNHRPAPRVR